MYVIISLRHITMIGPLISANDVVKIAPIKHIQRIPILLMKYYNVGECKLWEGKN